MTTFCQIHFPFPVLKLSCISAKKKCFFRFFRWQSSVLPEQLSVMLSQDERYT